MTVFSAQGGPIILRQILERGRQKSIAPEGSGFQKSTFVKEDAICEAKHFLESGVVVSNNHVGPYGRKSLGTYGG